MSEKIYIGEDLKNPLCVFDNATMQKCSCVLSSSLSGDQLAIDQFLPVVYSGSYIRVNFAVASGEALVTSDGSTFAVYPGTPLLDKIPYSTPIWYFSNDVLIGKFYSQKIIRTGKTFFDVIAVSAIGILDGQRHYGGIYTGEKFSDVASDIIGGSFPFVCSEDVSSVAIYGWLPIDTKRANLHQLLFACGAVLDKTGDGTVYFKFPDSQSFKNVPDNRIFLGGNVDYMTPATRVEVTEHLYESLENDEEVVLFDNTQSGAETANNTLVSFSDAPIHSLSASGNLEINESGTNYAVVSGIGVLKGKKYTHITKTIVKEANNGEKDKTVTVTDATLVSVANSENVATRVLSYYSSAKTIRSDIVLNGEKPGDQILFNNAFGEPESAFLSNIEISASSFLRASCELVTGYVPSGGGNNYTQTVVLTGAGTWTVPEGVSKIRVAIIGGGSGGVGGNAGGNADSKVSVWSDDLEIASAFNFYGDGSAENTARHEGSGIRSMTVQGGEFPGDGGAPGTPGDGGKILVVSLDVTPGQTFSYSCGTGGDGGDGGCWNSTSDYGDVTDVEWKSGLDGYEYTPKFSSQAPTSGEEGTDTVFGGYTSADGQRQSYGYYDVITGVLYGATGEAGAFGESGNLGGVLRNVPSQSAENTEEVAASVVTESGKGINPGFGGYAKWKSDTSNLTDRYKWFAASGGGTPGAAFGASAERGGSTETGAEYSFAGGNFATPGTGKPGTNAVVADDALVIGCGGQGGHGGGGGSCAGAAWSYFTGIYSNYSLYRFGGLGGSGSSGGKGAPGGIVINL